ncbi:MAG: UDP-N-acetylmuramoyl-L-alanyl-D-glutamate--2,6-diaminopimelate ligase [bacterium]
MANKTVLRLTRTILRPFRSVFRPLFPQWLVNYFYHLPIAFLAARMYGNPGKDLEIIGVTGTDGKTTTSLLIYHILKTARKKVAVITTIEARIGRKKIKTGFHVTSPNSWKLQKLLRQIRSRKFRYVVLETTSHGLDQFRLYPLRPSVAVLTNITHEHLDYHKTFKKYLQAKLKLFRHAKHAVINKDLPIFSVFNESLPKVHFSTYSLTSDSQMKPSEVKFFKTSTKFLLGNIEYTSTLTGRYNLYNTLAAISTCLILDISPSEIKRALASFPAVKGRLEPIENKHGIRAYIDFAHTPNALHEVLSNLASQKAPGEKLVVVFGSAGLRDKSKRPLMGTAASEFADSIILTSEDPRTEDAQSIAEEILAGIPESKRVSVEIEINRGKAITKAVEQAKKGDYLVICGKGHEETMCFGYTEYPWSDQETLAQALKEKSSE